MPISSRTFRTPDDYAAISDFLYGLYQPNGGGNWFQPMWEYAYTHPMFDPKSVSHIGIWEDDEIVAVANYELWSGDAFFQIAPGYSHLKEEMLTYAEEHLANPRKDGSRSIRAFVNDFDAEFERILESRGYTFAPNVRRPMTRLPIPDPFPPVEVPDGFTLKSLADDCDLAKLHRVLWRGFDHEGEPPEDGIAERERMISGPNHRKDLWIVVEAPTGEFAATCGMWYEPVNRFAYVEPVATDPDFRRMGLGRAAVMEGIRRCGELGATVAYVGADMPFYLSMGFTPAAMQVCWTKHIPAD